MSGRSRVLQRKCACGGAAAQHGECEECKKKRQSSLQRNAVGAGSGVAPPIVHDVLRSPGQPLDSGARARLEPQFAYNFSDVRVHTDSQAAASAKAVDAVAYTVGNRIVFDSGQYSPRTVRGHQLLAHELTHVVQQRDSAPAGDLMVETANSDAEREADRAGFRAITETPQKGTQASPLPSKRVQRTVGGAIAGALLGGIAGAVLGSFLGPAGAILGGLAGLVIGGLLGNLDTRSRKLKPSEITMAKEIFKDSIDYSKIEITRDSLFAVGAPRTIGNTIHLKSTEPWLHFKGNTLDLSDESSPHGSRTGEQTLIHEMTHVWQYQNGGIAYMPQSIIAQIKASASGGDRGGAYNWRDAIKAKTPWVKWNPEQQAELVEDYNISLRRINSHTGTAGDYQTVSDALPYIRMLQNREGAPTFFGSDKSDKKVQKKSRSDAPTPSGKTTAPPIVHDALRSPGTPLDAATRSFMETRFGQDFSGVRLHTDAMAAQSTRAVDALAYTVGSDIVIDRSYYDASTGRGAHLLAHELAHVAQQSASGSARSGKLLVGAAHDPAERDAEQAADRVMSGNGAVVGHRDSHEYVRRQPAGQDDEPKKDPKPWLRFGDWVINPQATVPFLGSGTLEDIHKVAEAVHPSDKDKNPCPSGWRRLRINEKESRCCQGYPTDEKHCCSPKELTIDRGVWACKPAPDKPKSEAPRPDAPQKAPAPAPGEINRNFKLKLPPLPDLTVDRPIHFLLDQPAAPVANEAALRANLTAEGKSDLTRVIDWLIKFPQFGVQLTGMASIEGPTAHNMQLGEARARSVANVLVMRGIDPHRITEPVGGKDDCPPVSAGIHNCGDSHASKTIDPNDRQVRARLFVLPESPAKRP